MRDERALAVVFVGPTMCRYPESQCDLPAAYPTIITVVFVATQTGFLLGKKKLLV